MQSVDCPIRIGAVLECHLKYAGAETETLHRLGDVGLTAATVSARMIAFCGPWAKLSKALRAALIQEIGRVSLLLMGYDGKYNTKRQGEQIFPLTCTTNSGWVLVRMVVAPHWNVSDFILLTQQDDAVMLCIWDMYKVLYRIHLNHTIELNAAFWVHEISVMHTVCWPRNRFT